MATVKKSSSGKTPISSSSEVVLRRSKEIGADLKVRAAQVKNEISSHLDKIDDAKLKASTKRWLRDS